jgi:hypothetical protein
LKPKVYFEIFSFIDSSWTWIPLSCLETYEENKEKGLKKFHEVLELAVKNGEETDAEKPWYKRWNSRFSIVQAKQKVVYFQKAQINFYSLTC